MYDAGSVLRIILARYHTTVLLNPPHNFILILPQEELVMRFWVFLSLVQLNANLVAQWTTVKDHNWLFHIHGHFHVSYGLRFIISDHNG
jgi:hypothetical protein